mgnify:FL=1|tara:strand:+ start:282 stop:659 length:378 start_codon:yes stop_codon:yes gene_type:complete
MTLQDTEGNSIIATKVTANQINLYLNILGKSKNIGWVDPINRVFRVKRKRAKHLLKKADSYGFNYHIVSTGQLFDYVLLTDEYGTYKIPKEVVLSGKFLFFKQQGFEKQIFLTLTEIEKYDIKAS